MNVNPKCKCCNPMIAISNKVPSFIEEESDTKFEFTEEEHSKLDRLLAWQELSEKSTYIFP